jgi:putative membrane protein
LKDLGKYKIELIFLVVVHMAGLIGIKWIHEDLFLQLSFVSLIIPLLIIIYRLKISFKSILLLLAVFLISFIAEWLGVNGGYLFGEYVYGKSLGFKIDGVPPLIAINWVLLCLVSREITIRFFSSAFMIVVVSSLLMLAIDFVIEPVADKLDFWSWSENEIPLSNYRDWFMVALINQMILLFFKSENKVFSLTLGYLVILVVFFLCFY